MTSVGLSDLEVERARVEHGRNELPPPHRRSILERILRQLIDPMILLLIGACAITVLLDDVSDSIIIGVVVVLNTTIGVAQELRAENALQALHAMSAPVCRVVRAGVPHLLPATELVPGDVIQLNAGDVVPADAELLEVHVLAVNEAAMTGESFPIDRDVGDIVRSGTVVTRGRGVARVSLIGSASGLGQIAEAVASAPMRATPLQRRLTRLSRDLVIATTAVCVLVLVLGLLRGRSLEEMVLVAVSLGVAAVPESLPAVVTIALALGAFRMAQRSAIVRSLPAVETLGSVTVLAVDKTGTITEGRLQVSEVWTPASVERDSILRAMVLCNDAQVVVRADGGQGVEGDPLEVALIEYAEKEGVRARVVRPCWPRLDELPFDEKRRSMTTRHLSPEGERLTIVKGAPEAVLVLLSDPDMADQGSQAAARLAGEGHRVLAVVSAADAAAATTRGSYDLLGLIAMTDPPRAASREVLDTCRHAGVRVMIVTGDHADTARAVANGVGLVTSESAVAMADELSEGDSALDTVNVVARTRPEQKVDIVHRLQNAGHVVAMTGDGVNDAPALRSADIGVAMGRGGTEVARQAAELVLADDDLRTVVVAIEEGRRILANIRTFLRYALSGGLAEVLVMIVAPFLGMSSPLLPGQILWINMLTHGLPGVAFGAEPADPAVMRRPSASPDKSVLGDRLWLRVAGAGSLIAIVTLIAGTGAGDIESDQQTAMFVVLGLAQLGLALALRSSNPDRRGLSGHGVELAVLLSALCLAAAVVLEPLRDLLHTAELSGGWLSLLLLAAIPGAVVGLLRRRNG